MFDPHLLGIDLPGVIVAVISFIILPLLAQIRPVYRVFRRYASLIPVVVSVIVALNYPKNNNARARNVFLGIGFFLVNIHDVVVSHRRNSSVYKKRVQFGRVAGIVVLWLLGFATQGVNPLIDFIPSHITGEFIVEYKLRLRFVRFPMKEFKRLTIQSNF